MTQVITAQMLPPGTILCEFCNADATLDGGTLEDVLLCRPGVSYMTIRHESWCPCLRAHQQGNRAARRAARRGGQR